jgi:hypothetical protein
MEKMYKKISCQIINISVLLLVYLIGGCARSPRNVPASVHQIPTGYQVKMAEFTIVFPNDWEGSIAPGINQTDGYLARQEIHAFNQKLSVKLRYYSEKYGWASYKRWVDDYQNIYKYRNCIVNRSKIDRYEYTKFVCNENHNISFTILVDCQGSTLVVNGTASSEQDISYFIKMLSNLNIKRD